MSLSFVSGILSWTAISLYHVLVTISMFRLYPILLSPPPCFVSILFSCHHLHVSCRFYSLKQQSLSSFMPLFFSFMQYLQRHNTKNLKQIFLKKELRGHSPNFQIHVSVNDLYIPTIELPIFCCRKYEGRSCEYINRSQRQACGNWDWGPAIPRKGIHK